MLLAGFRESIFQGQGDGLMPNDITLEPSTRADVAHRVSIQQAYIGLAPCSELLKASLTTNTMPNNTTLKASQERLLLPD